MNTNDSDRENLFDLGHQEYLPKCVAELFNGVETHEQRMLKLLLFAQRPITTNELIIGYYKIHNLELYLCRAVKILNRLLLQRLVKRHDKRGCYSTLWSVVK